MNFRKLSIYKCDEASFFLLKFFFCHFEANLKNLVAMFFESSHGIVRFIQDD